MKTTISIYLRNKPDKNDECPIVMRITKNRQSKVITLGLKAQNEYWDYEQKRFNRKAKNYQQKNRALIKLEDRAFDVLNEFLSDNPHFTLNEFEAKFRGLKKNKITVRKYLTGLIEDLDSVSKYGASEPYKNLKSSLFKYANKTIVFKDVDFKFLKGFENFLRKEGNTDGGIAFKMRELRTLYNKAINSDLVDSSFYPFRKYKISKLKGDSNKIALTANELRRFEKADLSERLDLLISHKLFMFSFYCRGINWVDMMELKWADIYDGKIHYKRKKTKQSFVIETSEKLEDILKYFKNNFSNSGYVFPILLKDGLTPKQKRNRKQKTIKKFNKDLKGIAKLVGIDKPVTSYVARHTYATYLYNKGKSVEIISASMGHSSVLVTMNYLKEFEDSVLDEANRILFEEPLIAYA